MKSLTKIYIIGLLATFIMGSFIVQAQIKMLDNNLNNSYLSNSKPQLSASLTTSFTSFGQGFNSIGTSFMPQITFPISNKFTISTGIGYSTFFIGNGSEGLFQSNQSNYGHVFVSGNYFVNEKISLRGTAYKTFMPESRNSMAESNYPFYDLSSQGIIMDVEYRVTDNFRINVGFEYRQQNYPLYYPGMNYNSPQINGFSAFPVFNPNPGFNSY